MKYDKINLMVPTYKRVKNGKLPRFIESVFKHTSDIDNICFSFLVNYEDDETLNYLNNFKNSGPYMIQILQESERSPHLGKFYNHLYDNSRYDKPKIIVSMVGDDMEFLTSGYDLAILNAINKCNGMGIVYCNDDFVQGKKLCVNLFTTRKLVEATRFPFMCEKFQAYYIDTVWMEVGKRLNLLHYLDHVKIKHHHMSAKKSNVDETAQRLQKVKLNFSKGLKEVKQYIKPIIKNLQGVKLCPGKK